MSDSVCLPCVRREHHACIAYSHGGKATEDTCWCFDGDPGQHHAARMSNVRRVPRPADLDHQQGTLIDDRPPSWSQRRPAKEAEAAATSIRALGSQYPEWAREADRAFRTVANRQPTLNTDDVWKELQKRGIPAPGETRAMGTAVRRAMHAGIITLKDPNVRPKMWRSNTYRSDQ